MPWWMPVQTDEAHLLAGETFVSLIQPFKGVRLLIWGLWMSFRGYSVNILKFSADVSYVRVYVDFHLTFTKRSCVVQWALEAHLQICIPTHCMAV